MRRKRVQCREIRKVPQKVPLLSAQAKKPDVRPMSDLLGPALSLAVRDFLFWRLQKNLKWPLDKKRVLL